MMTVMFVEQYLYNLPRSFNLVSFFFLLLLLLLRVVWCRQFSFSLPQEEDETTGSHLSAGLRPPLTISTVTHDRPSFFLGADLITSKFFELFFFLVCRESWSSSSNFSPHTNIRQSCWRPCVSFLFVITDRGMGMGGYFVLYLFNLSTDGKVRRWWWGKRGVHAHDYTYIYT